MMAALGPILLQLLLLGGLQCRGDKMAVTQWPPFHVTLAKKSVNINCTITCMYSTECASFTLSFYKLDSQGKVVPLTGYPKTIKNLPASNTTVFNSTYSEALLWNSSMKDSYYCSAAWQSVRKEGGGIFIEVRDKGYRSPKEGHQTLRFCLIAFSSILIALGFAETGVILLWKRKGYPLWPHRKSHEKSANQQATTACSSSEVEAHRASAIYTSLQPDQVNLYDVIEKGASGQTKEKDPPGPNRCASKIQHIRQNKEVNGQTGKKKRRKSKQVVHAIPKPESDLGSNFDAVYENL